MLYTVSDYNTKMNKSTLKRKEVSSTFEQYNKCTTSKKALNFADLCIEIIRQQIDDLKLGKFVLIIL